MLTIVTRGQLRLEWQTAGPLHRQAFHLNDPNALCVTLELHVCLKRFVLSFWKSCIFVHMGVCRVCVCVCVFGASLPSSEMEQTDKVVMEQWVYGDEMMRGNEVSRALWQCRILSRLSSHVISFHGHKVRTSPYHRVRRVSLLLFFLLFFCNNWTYRRTSCRVFVCVYMGVS